MYKQTVTYQNQFILVQVYFILKLECLIDQITKWVFCLISLLIKPDLIELVYIP